MNHGDVKRCAECRKPCDGSRWVAWRDVFACSEECERALSRALDDAHMSKEPK